MRLDISLDGEYHIIIVWHKCCLVLLWKLHYSKGCIFLHLIIIAVLLFASTCLIITSIWLMIVYQQILVCKCLMKSHISTLTVLISRDFVKYIVIFDFVHQALPWKLRVFRNLTYLWSKCSLHISAVSRAVNVLFIIGSVSGHLLNTLYC